MIEFRVLCAKCVPIDISFDISYDLLDFSSVVNWVFPVAETVLICGIVKLSFNATNFLSGLQVGSRLLLTILRHTFIRHARSLHVPLFNLIWISDIGLTLRDCKRYCKMF